MTEGKDPTQTILESLESIKNHLNKQDTESKANTWATVWIALIIVGFSITIGGIIQIINASGYVTVGYGIILIVVFAIMAITQRMKK
ncbi:MAG: hypothetical protein ABSA18_05175 [Dehalococcoidia bacterium]|jgi:hypothetical protein